MPGWQQFLKLTSALTLLVGRLEGLWLVKHCCSNNSQNFCFGKTGLTCNENSEQLVSLTKIKSSSSSDSDSKSLGHTIVVVQ